MARELEKNGRNMIEQEAEGISGYSNRNAMNTFFKIYRLELHETKSG